MSIKSLVAEQIKKARKDAGLTLRALGDRVGLAESTMSLYEKARRSPDFDILGRIADATGRPLSWFFDGAIPGVTGATPAARTLTKNVAKSTRGGASSQKLLKARLLLQAAPAAIVQSGRCDLLKSA